MNSNERQFMQEKAAEAAALLHTIGNQHRLLILCLLIKHGELTVGEMLEYVELSQSALSQHLAKMREAELVSFRRESQTLYYQIKNPAVKEIVSLLESIFCP